MGAIASPWRCGESALRPRQPENVWIKWIGTHKDYDKIDVKGVQHGG